MRSAAAAAAEMIRRSLCPSLQREHFATGATRNLATTSPAQQRRLRREALADAPSDVPLHIEVTPERTFIISGTIPPPGPLTGGCEVSIGGPQGRCQNFAKIPFNLSHSG